MVWVRPVRGSKTEPLKLPSCPRQETDMAALIIIQRISKVLHPARHRCKSGFTVAIRDNLTRIARRIRNPLPPRQYTAALGYSLIVFVSCGGALAQSSDFDIKRPQWKQLSAAYGFLAGQERALELVATRFPQLAGAAKQADLQFQLSSLGEGADGLRKSFKELLGDKWEEVDKEMRDALYKTIDAQKFELAEAEAFVAELRGRAKGKLPEEFRRTLLANNPRFKQDPGLELSEGWRRTFRTKGHPKAGSVDVSIDVPESWYERDGRQSDIVKVFRSGNGHGDLLLMISVVPFTDSEKAEMAGVELSADVIEEFLPDGAQVLTRQETMLAGAKSVMTVFDQKQEQLGQIVAMRNTVFWLLLNDGMVALTFAFMKPQSMRSEQIEETHKRQMPSYKLIANTLSLTGSKPHQADADITQAEAMSGTGFAIDSSGLVLTALHVVDGAETISVLKNSKSYEAEILTSNKTLDLALLKVSGAAFTPVRFAPSATVKLAQGVFTIGFPNADVQGLSPKVTRGEISSLHGMRDSPRHWQISAPVQPGNSGGPLFDETGSVIGMVVSTLRAEIAGAIPQNVNYALKGDFMRKAIATYAPRVVDNTLGQHTEADNLENVVARVQASVVMVSAE
jgi:S1-C subfamily serine protease